MKGYVINMKESKERLEQFKENILPFPVERFEALTPTFLGLSDTPEHRDWACSLSHVAVIKQLTEFPSIVFEDDCVMLNSWDYVEQIMAQLPDNWDCLYLGANLQKPLERYSENLYKLHSGHAIHAVIYNSKALVDYAVAHYSTKEYRCFDVLMAYDVQKKYNCFVAYPIVASQRSGMSDINGKFLDNYNLIIEGYNKNVK